MSPPRPVSPKIWHNNISNNFGVVMMITSQVMEQLEQLPESLQAKVLDYVKLLQQANIKETETTLELPIKKRRSGILKGTFVLPLPKDFDQPLEDLVEEQVSIETASKKRGGLGILKGKIWMSEDFDEPLEEFKDY
jgi:hypothetical protein